MSLTQSLLTVKNNMAYPSEYARTVQCFKDLITRDRGSVDDSQGRKKYQACREFAYIYFMEDPTSPFRVLPEEEKKKKIIDEIFPEEWEPDEKVEEAQRFYRESVETIALKLLKSAYKSVHELRDYFEELDLNERDKNERLLNNPKDVVKLLSDLGNVIEGLEKLEERVKTETKDASDDIRGGVEVNKYSE